MIFVVTSSPNYDSEHKGFFAGEVTTMLGLIHKNSLLHFGFLWICRGFGGAVKGESFNTVWGSALMKGVHSSSGCTRVCHNKVLLFLVDLEPTFAGKGDPEERMAQMGLCVSHTLRGHRDISLLLVLLSVLIVGLFGFASQVTAL